MKIGAMESAGASGVDQQRETRQQRANRQIAATVAAQAGVISRSQLIAAGLGGEAIRHRAASGRLCPVFPDVFALAIPIPLMGRRIAALLSTAPSFISHRDAGEHHGLITPIPGPVHVTVARHRNLKRRGIMVHRTSHLHPDERRVHGPMRVTSPARTLVDIAGELTARQLTRAYDEAIRLGSATPVDVLSACERAGGRPGTGRLVALATESHLPLDRTRSLPEARFLRFCSDHGLPIPLVNVPLLGLEVDFLWPTQKLVVEMDSSHHDSPRAQAADAARDAQLDAAGFRVERIRPRRLATAPGVLAAGLRALIAEAAAA